MSNSARRPQAHSKTSFDSPGKFYASIVIAVIVAGVSIAGVMIWYRQQEKKLMLEFSNSK